MSKVIHKYFTATKTDDYTQQVSLELYEDLNFKLSNEIFGFFGTSSNFYHGNYRFDEKVLILEITKASRYSYTAVDDEPSEGAYAFQETIVPEIAPNDKSIKFIFPASRGEWEIIMEKIM